MSDEFRIFLGSGAQHFRTVLPESSLGKITLKSFPSGEKYCRFDENIRDKDIFLLQSLSNPVNDNLMELLVMADAARRASAGRITFVMPYMGYQRQDRKTVPREPISAKLTIDLMENAGATRLMTMDAHNLCCQGFTNLPFDHLSSLPLIQERFQELNLRQPVFVAPDVGAVKRTQAFAALFDSDLAIVNKKRLSASEVVAQTIIGDVRNSDAVIVDDLTESCQTLIKAAEICQHGGSLTQTVVVTHCCLTQQGMVNLQEAFDKGIITRFVTTNTINNPYVGLHPKIKIMDAAPLIYNAIYRVHSGDSVTEMFDLKGY